MKHKTNTSPQYSYASARSTVGAYGRYCDGSSVHKSPKHQQH
jgi:hypothetical protein